MHPVKAPSIDDMRGLEAEFKWEENTNTDSCRSQAVIKAATPGRP